MVAYSVQSYYLVLIETYWNVNLRYLSHKKVRMLRINRNILECK